MNINYLKYARAVAATRSFSKAAEICCVTQPTLSNAISQLEDQLGERLFVRTTRKVDLTPFGRLHLPLIEKVLEAQSELVSRVVAFRDQEKQIIQIGVSPLICTKHMTKIIEQFRAINPNVEIVLRQANMADLYQHLEVHALDLIFVVVGQKMNHHDSVILYEEQLYFIPKLMNVTSRPKPGKIFLNDVASETIILVPDTCGLTRTIREVFESRRLDLNEYTGQAHGYHILEEWACLGIGAAILPQSKLSSANQTAQPIFVDTEKPLTLSYEAVWKKNTATARHIEQFVAHLKSTAPC